jgi:ABC-type nitrate/sulfonate/bicarbonate transport system ATPase subunit
MAATASAGSQPHLTVPPALEVQSIEASYVDRRVRLPVLAGVSLSVAHGEFVTVIGPSGSGKSTLLDIVAGLIEPDRGEISLAGIAASASSRLGRSSYMRQRDLLFPWRTVLDNAGLALEVAGITRREARARVRERLAEFGLAEFEGAYPTQLSGGMRQRAAFLRTMLGGRPLMLLDEPFGGLDALTRVSMQDWLLDRLAKDRRSLLMVTHDVEEAIYLSDLVVVLSGRPATVVHVERIALPRPRVRSVVAEPVFIEHKTSILRELGLFSGSGRG